MKLQLMGTVEIMGSLLLLCLQPTFWFWALYNNTIYTRRQYLSHWHQIFSRSGSCKEEALHGWQRVL